MSECSVIRFFQNRFNLQWDKSGMSQREVGEVVGVKQPQMSAYSAGNSLPRVPVLRRIAVLFSVSVDYLLGLTDDPTPAAALARQVLGVEMIVITPEPVAAGKPGDIVEVREPETPYPFRQSTLDAYGMTAANARVFVVQGDSMNPILTDGAHIVVDYGRTVLRHNHIYVIRTNGNLLVKRARRSNGFWRWHSDAPGYAPFPHSHLYRIWGQVRWVGKQFDENGE